MIIGNLEIHRKRLRGSLGYAKKFFNNKKIDAIEVGVWRGDHAKDMLDNLNLRKLILIDPYVSYDSPLSEDILSAKAIAVDKLKNYPNKEWIFERAEDVKTNEKFDYIYIDGDHSYEHIKPDIDKFYLYVKDNGILAGHDINKEGVLRAVFDFCKKKKTLPLIRGEDWIILK